MCAKRSDNNVMRHVHYGIRSRKCFFQFMPLISILFYSVSSLCVIRVDMELHRIRFTIFHSADNNPNSNSLRCSSRLMLCYNITHSRSSEGCSSSPFFDSLAHCRPHSHSCFNCTITSGTFRARKLGLGRASKLHLS